MTSISNLFSNLDDFLKPTSITDYASNYNKNFNLNLNTLTPGLTQGEKFKHYQEKIQSNLEKNLLNVNSKEGFQNSPEYQSNNNIDFKKMNLDKNGLTVQSNRIIRKNNLSPEQNEEISDLKEQYNNTLTEYQNLLANISGSTTGYINRVNSNNPYLNKFIRFSGGQECYVTNQGVAKYIPSTSIMDSLINTPNNFIELNIPWDNSYATAGATIPTTPSLITGTPVQANQSLGNEGTNIFVNELINSNTTATYNGCYADNSTTSLMTFIGGAPPPASISIQNGNFDEPQLTSNSYTYLTPSTSNVPGWVFNCILVNNSTAWGFTMPYPYGNQCACIQMTGELTSVAINFTTGVTYSLSFSACGRDCCDGSGLANPINIGLNGVTFYTLNATVNVWTTFTTTFTVQTTGNQTLTFIGTSVTDESTALQNIQLTTGQTDLGTYTYSQCKEAAIDAGYQYFSLQNVNPSTSTGYCGITKSQPTATSLGTSYIPSGQVVLWSSGTSGQTGNTAILNTSGSLSVINSGGQSVFSTPNSLATPSNYLGCYGDSATRAMTLYNGGSQEYDNQQCQQIAASNNNTYFALQNSTSGTNAQCTLSNDLSQAIEYGTAGNCTLLSDGTYSGGGYSNAIYNNSTPTSNYYLILDDGNLSIYRGTNPNDNQGLIWSSGTTGLQQDANPNYTAANSTYGQNWIASGTTLAAGDFVGSTNGNLSLIMGTDGNLVLYTYSNVINCQTMNDGNTGGGVNANALYDIGVTGIPGNLSQVGYIDQNSELHSYPSTNVQYINSYTEFTGTNSANNDIAGASFGNATISSCEDTCNNNPDCAGFVTNTDGTMCWPKTNNMYPTGKRQINPDYNMYVRSKGPISTPIGVPNTVNNINSIMYGNYFNGGNIANEYGLSQATSVEQEQLSQLQGIMNLLSNQINFLTDSFSQGTQQAESQSQTNVTGIKNYVYDIKKTNKQIKHFNKNFDNILKDSDIVVLQKNYDYLFWTILAIGTILISLIIIRK